MLIKSGSLAIAQLSEALSASASSNKLADGIPQNAMHLCSEQVGFVCFSRKFFCLSDLSWPYYFEFIHSVEIFSSLLNLLLHLSYSFLKAMIQSMGGLDLPRSFQDQLRFNWCSIGPKSWRKLESQVQPINARKWSFLVCNAWQEGASMTILGVAFIDTA